MAKSVSKSMEDCFAFANVQMNAPISNTFAGIPPGGSGQSTGYATMRKRPEISVIQDNNHIRMNPNDIHLQAISNGFLLTSMDDRGNIKINSFNVLREVLEHMDNLGLMDLDSSEVADNV